MWASGTTLPLPFDRPTTSSCHSGCTAALLLLLSSMLLLLLLLSSATGVAISGPILIVFTLFRSLRCCCASLDDRSGADFFFRCNWDRERGKRDRNAGPLDVATPTVDGDDERLLVTTLGPVTWILKSFGAATTPCNLFGFGYFLALTSILITETK